MNEIKLLTKAYAKRFKQLNKNILATNDAGLAIFAEHLKYLRDVFIITHKPAEQVIALNTAIEEFEAFKQTNEDTHWANFCHLVKLHMKEWLTI